MKQFELMSELTIKEQVSTIGGCAGFIDPETAAGLRGINPIIFSPKDPWSDILFSLDDLICW